MAQEVTCDLCGDSLAFGWFAPTAGGNGASYFCNGGCADQDQPLLALFTMDEWVKRGKPYDGRANPLVVT